MMTSSEEAIHLARMRLPPRRRREARQLCLAYHDMPLYSMLNGLACVTDAMRDQGMPARGYINDFCDVARAEWEILHERGQGAVHAYAKGYSVGRWGHDMELNPHSVDGMLWDHWNDGWRRGYEDLAEAMEDGDCDE